MPHLTTLDELKQHVTLLASVEESDAPFISCYLNLEDEPDSWRKTLDDRARVLRRILSGNDLADFEEALGKIETWLATNLLPGAKGAALFVRGTFGGAFMLPMQFAVPLPNWFAVYPTPNIYHLVELKDNYHRYVVLLAMPERACILEVNLGAATIRAWINEPDLRARVGQEWSRPHYQVNRAHRGDRFVQGKIAVLEQLMRSGGHTHLILAGDTAITGRIRNALPGYLADKLVEIIPAAETDQQADVVMATLASFIAHEEQESRTVAERLIEGLRSQNLAVAGSAARAGIPAQVIAEVIRIYSWDVDFQRDIRQGDKIEVLYETEETEDVFAPALDVSLFSPPLLREVAGVLILEDDETHLLGERVLPANRVGLGHEESTLGRNRVDPLQVIEQQDDRFV